MAKEISKTLNNQIAFEFFDSISYGKGSLSFSDFRRQYEFISVVFLQEGCAPCYPKFVEWHRKMKSITQPDNYTTLFVINARSYQHFTDGSGATSILMNDTIM
jgi:hypothetical protein